MLFKVLTLISEILNFLTYKIQHAAGSKVLDSITSYVIIIFTKKKDKRKLKGRFKAFGM
jgi:hypothetical protein